MEPCAGIPVRGLHLHCHHRPVPALLRLAADDRLPLGCAGGLWAAVRQPEDRRRKAPKRQKKPPFGSQTASRRRWRTSGRSGPPTRRSGIWPGCIEKIDQHEKVTIRGELTTGLFVNAASVIMRLGVATTILTGAQPDLVRADRLHAAVPVPAGHHPGVRPLRPEPGPHRGNVCLPGVGRPHERDLRNPHRRRGGDLPAPGPRHCL